MANRNKIANEDMNVVLYSRRPLKTALITVMTVIESVGGVATTVYSNTPLVTTAIFGRTLEQQQKVKYTHRDIKHKNEA